jgi:pimeloyl-ACP methyl ester carboxylesterase
MVRHDATEGPLFARVAGHGPVFALIHPNPLDSWAWAYQSAHFSTWFRTVAVDLPGYGESAPAPEGVTIPDVAELVWETLTRIGPPPYVVAGVSLGARVAKEIAASHPDGVSALILSGTRGPTGSREFALERRNEFAARGLAYRADYVLELFSPEFRETDIARYFATIYDDRASLADLESILRLYDASMVAPDPPPEARIRCPTLVISGSRDKAWEGSLELAASIENAEHQTVEGAGHAPNLEQPWEYDRRVLAFISQHGLLPPRA